MGGAGGSGEVDKCRDTPGLWVGERGADLVWGLGGWSFQSPGAILGEGILRRTGRARMHRQKEGQTDVGKCLTQQREESDKEMGTGGQRDPQGHCWADVSRGQGAE